MAKIKLLETQLEQNQKEISISSKIKILYNQLLNYKEQVNLLQKNYSNYLRLQQGEETRFFNGESTLFLVNGRESKALETSLKLTETAVKLNITNYKLAWASGRLWKL